MNRWNSKHWSCTAGASALFAVMAFGSIGCGSKAADTAAGAGVTLSGSLATTGSRFVKNASERYEGMEFLNPHPTSRAVDLTTLSVQCVTSTDSGKGSVSAAGIFSVTVPNSAGKQIGCFIFQSDTIVGSLVFSDPNKKSLSGSSSTSSNQAFTGDAVLPAITLNLSTGQALVDITQVTSPTGGSAIATTIVAKADAFDYSGKWVITAMPAADLRASEKGVYNNTLCSGGGGGNCQGPPANQALEIIRGVGTYHDGSPAYAALLWQSSTGYEDCGSKIGTTFAQIKTDTGADFSGSGLGEGTYTWSATAPVNGVTKTLTNGWQITGATSPYPVQDCINTSVAVGGATLPGQLCHDTTDGVYAYSLFGGCVDANNIPIQPTNWSGVTGSGSCTVADLGGGFKSRACPRTYNSAAITCTDVYSDDRNASGGGGAGAYTFQYTGVAQQSNNCATLLANASDSIKLAGLECFANVYQQAGLDHAAGVCVPKIITDWNATTSAGFLQSTNKPASQVVANLFSYDAGGQSGVLHDEQDDSQGVQGQNGQIGCKVHSTVDLSLEKVSANQMRAKYSQHMTYRLGKLDQGYSASCAAAIGSGATEAFIFYFNRQ